MAELNEVVPESAPSTGPGARLKAGRQAQNQSLEQAARHLRLDEPTLAAIEADQYPAHVPATFLRGYLRAYAKWLELPADEIVAAYNNQQPDEAQLAGLKSLLPLPESESSGAGKWFGMLIVVVLLAVVVVGAIVLTPSDWLDRLKATDSSSDVASEQVAAEVLPIDSSSGEIALQLAPETPLPLDVSVPAEAQTESAPVSGVTPADKTATTSTPASAATSPSATASKPTSVSTTASEPVPGIGEAVEFSFLEDCWIRVTDGAGNVLSVGIKQKGQRIRLSGSAPLTVVLGNPPGVQLKHNGRPVDLSPYPASRPATLTLQQQTND